MTKFFTVLFLVFFSSVKFVLVPPLAVMQYNLTFIESVSYTTLGGSAGVLLFYFLSKEILIAWMYIMNKFRRKHERKLRRGHTGGINRIRSLVRLKNRWGLVGLVALTPCLLSIPLGTFLAAKFFPGRRTIILLCLSVFGWSLLLNGLFIIIQGGA